MLVSPASLQARATRTAISPRFAMRTLRTFLPSSAGEPSLEDRRPPRLSSISAEAAGPPHVTKLTTAAGAVLPVRPGTDAAVTAGACPGAAARVHAASQGRPPVGPRRRCGGLGPGGAGGRRAGGEQGDERGQLLLGRLPPDDPQRGPPSGLRRRVRRSAAHGVAHSGMFPCFFGGSDSRLVRSNRSALTTSRRVTDGEMTAST